MKKIALISDGQGWIVDRISRTYQQYIQGIEVFYQSSLSSDAIVYIVKNFDLIHFNNFFVRGLQPLFLHSPIPTIVSIRSFRYTHDIPLLAPSLFHVIHPNMCDVFKPSVFIPDGIDTDLFRPDRKFRVGIAYQDGYAEFKGADLLTKAAEGLDIEILQVSNLPHEDMKQFYQSLDLYVCASASEGFAAPIVECMALNIPVMSTRTGVASYIDGIHVVDRSVDSIREGLLRHITRQRILDLSWPAICRKINNMYDAVLHVKPHDSGLVLPEN